MNTTVKSTNNHYLRRKVALDKLSKVDPFMEGYVSSFKRHGYTQAKLVFNIQTERKNPHRMCARGFSCVSKIMQT
jgi:hypothetical protein